MRIVSILAGVVLATAASAQTCVFASFIRPCGADLAGQQVRSPAGSAVRFDVTNAAPNCFAVMVVGQEMARGIQLPGSNCLLVVQPRATLVQQVDAAGATSFRFHLPPISPIDLDFQVVTVALSRNGRTAESTNGVGMRCR
jgi:hypothetical protein